MTYSDDKIQPIKSCPAIVLFSAKKDRIGTAAILSAAHFCVAGPALALLAGPLPSRCASRAAQQQGQTQPPPLDGAPAAVGGSASDACRSRQIHLSGGATPPLPLCCTAHGAQVRAVPRRSSAAIWAHKSNAEHTGRSSRVLRPTQGINGRGLRLGHGGSLTRLPVLCSSSRRCAGRRHLCRLSSPAAPPPPRRYSRAQPLPAAPDF